MAETPAIVDMIDAIGANAGAVPKGWKRVAIYLTGSGGVAWTTADVARLRADDPQLQSILRIDQGNSLLSLPVYLIKDIEPGAATLPVAIQEARQRKAMGLRTGFYFFPAEEQDVREAVTANGLDAWIDYWAAYWSLDREQAIQQLGHRGIKAVQYASPTSNPNTIVAGSNRTIAELNVDLSVTLADWPAPLPAPLKKPNPVKRVVKKVRVIHPKVKAGAATGGGGVGLVAILTAYGIHLTPAEAAAIPTLLYFIGAWLKKADVSAA